LKNNNNEPLYTLNRLTTKYQIKLNNH